MTWFAQPTQTADTPVVQRLLRCGVAAAQAQKLQCHCRHVSTSSQSDTESAPILLFCRLPDEPYVCFGRLALRDCDLTTRPLRFLWHLADVDVLRRELPSFAEFIGSPEAAKTSA